MHIKPRPKTAGLYIIDINMSEKNTRTSFHHRN